MSANKEKCADKEKSVCNYNDFRRPKYFHGMLLQDSDFSAEQDYHAQKRRFLNRMLHGSGVVCGLDLNGNKKGRSIEVTPGFALDCSGNEIWVPQTVPLDLEKLLPPKDKGKYEAECEEEEAPEPNTYYVGIRYQEKSSNPISVHLPSGGCEERKCENSRVKEGFCIELVPCCLKKPDSDKYPGLINGFCECTEDSKPDEKDRPLCPTCNEIRDNQELCRCFKMEKFCEQSVPCPECGSCDKPCHVVLGKIEVDKDFRLESICINECRSYVLTGHLLRHILQGVFAGGGEEYFEMHVKNDVEDEYIPLPENLWQWVYNPIKALCWWLPYKLRGGNFEWLGCDKQREGKDVQTQVSALQAQVDRMSTQLSRNTVDIRAIRGGRVLVAAEQIQPSAAAQAATEKAAEEKAAEEKAAAEKAAAEKAAAEKPPAGKPKGLPKQ